MDPLAITNAAILALNEILNIINSARANGVSDDQILAQAVATTGANSQAYNVLIAHLGK